jgi:hypothetical protein
MCAFVYVCYGLCVASDRDCACWCLWFLFFCVFLMFHGLLLKAFICPLQTDLSPQ